MAKKLVQLYESRIGSEYRKWKETEETETEFITRIVEEFPPCAHGHIIHNTAELGGRCVEGEWLCIKCATLQCSVDGNVVCKDHAFTHEDRVICSAHRPSRILWFSITGR